MGDTADTGIGAACPMLDCQDALTVTVLNDGGTPESSFSGTATPSEGDPVAFSCDAGVGSGAGFHCLSGGQVELNVHGETVELSVSEGPDGASWSGTLTPEWDSPYDSPECGHYCDLAEETVELEGCGDCG